MLQIINNALLYDELHQHEAELREMNELARQVNSKLDVEAIMRTNCLAAPLRYRNMRHLRPSALYCTTRKNVS